MRSLAESIGAALAVPVESVPPETFGVLGGLFTLDRPSSGALTRARFGGSPDTPPCSRIWPPATTRRRLAERGCHLRGAGRPARPGGGGAV